MIDEQYIDEHGIIATKEKDGGDSAFYMGHYYYLSMLSTPEYRYKFLIDASRFMSDSGLLRRHPDESKWYGDWDRGSRDQSIPFLAALFESGSVFAYKFFLSHLRRGFLFASNTRRNGTTLKNHGSLKSDGKRVRNYNWKLPDVTGPLFWALYIRGFRVRILYPFLFLFDIFLLFNTVTFNISPREPNQHLLLLSFARRRMPTPVSWLAYKLLNRGKVKNELRSYWRSQSHGNGYWRPYFIGDMWMEEYRCLK